VQLQAVTCSENQVIKGAKVREKTLDSLFVRDVNRLARGISTDGLDSFLNSFLLCWSDDDSAPCDAASSATATDSRRPTYDDHPLILETFSRGIEFSACAFCRLQSYR